MRAARHLKSAEDVLRRYRDSMERQGEVPSVSLTDARERCGRCGGGPRTLLGAGPRAKEVCASCKQRWLGEKVWFMAGTGGGPMHGIENRRKTARPRPKPRSGRSGCPRLESAVDDLVWLRAKVEPRPRDLTRRSWEQHIYATLLWLDVTAGGYAGVAAYAKDRFAGPPTPWTEWHVRCLVKSTLEIIQRRLAIRRRAEVS